MIIPAENGAKSFCKYIARHVRHLAWGGEGDRIFMFFLCVYTLSQLQSYFVIKEEENSFIICFIRFGLYFGKCFPSFSASK